MSCLFEPISIMFGIREMECRGPGAVESVHHCQLKSIEIVNSQDQVGPVYLQPLEQKPI